MSASPVTTIVEFLEIKEALCMAIHEYKASIRAENLKNPFWGNATKLQMADICAQRIFECDTLSQMGRLILSIPETVSDLKNLLIREADKQTQQLQNNILVR